MMKLLRKIKIDNSGASAAEYALIISLVGIAIIAGASLLGTNINTRLSTAANTISSGVAP